MLTLEQQLFGCSKYCCAIKQEKTWACCFLRLVLIHKACWMTCYSATESRLMPLCKHTRTHTHTRAHVHLALYALELCYVTYDTSTLDWR